jgi:hypothetical protein
MFTEVPAATSGPSARFIPEKPGVHSLQLRAHTVRLALAVLMGAAWLAFAQKYAGPIPEKEGVLYIVQADSLIATESSTTREQKGKKDETIYVIGGAASPARTPLASPAFIMKPKDLMPEKLQLYRLDVRNGHREITLRSGKRAKNPEPVHVEIKHLDGGLVQLQVSDSLSNGEYSFSPQGSNDVFCFEVY